MVPAASPARLALIAEALVPEPRLCTPVLVAPLSELLVAYRNQNCVAAPLGLTVPPSVAELLVTELAAPVVTVGATGIPVPVTVRMAPAAPVKLTL